MVYFQEERLAITSVLTPFAILTHSNGTSESKSTVKIDTGWLVGDGLSDLVNWRVGHWGDLLAVEVLEHWRCVHGEG